MSHLVHRATLLAVCVSAVTSLTCVIDTHVDVIISLPHLVMLRTFHCLLSTTKQWSRTSVIILWQNFS